MTARTRLLRMYLTSRHAAAALAVIAACAIALGFASRSHATGQVLPLSIEAAAALVIATAMAGPFGDPERVAGRRLPYLRLTAVMMLTGATVIVLVAGSATAHVPGEVPRIMRDVAGLTGVGLLSAAAVGGGPAWTGPVTYLVIAQHSMADGWTTPWTWPARPPGDLDAALCAALVFAAGTTVITARGPREAETRP